MKNDRITFTASVSKIQTLIDGGIRVTLDLPETAISQAAALMEIKRQMIPIEVEIIFGGENVSNNQTTKTCSVENT
jgi:hypothetical protein